MVDEFDDAVTVADQLRVFQQYKCSKDVVIKQMKSKFNEKDALVFHKNKLVSIIECKRRTRIFPSWILEVKKVMHWYENYQDLSFIYLNRFTFGDYYLKVHELGLEEHIKNDTLKTLDGSNGIRYCLGTRTDRNRYTDYDRDWLMIDQSLFKKIK